MSSLREVTATACLPLSLLVIFPYSHKSSANSRCPPEKIRFTDVAGRRAGVRIGLASKLVMAIDASLHTAVRECLRSRGREDIGFTLFETLDEDDSGDEMDAGSQDGDVSRRGVVAEASMSTIVGIGADADSFSGALFGKGVHDFVWWATKLYLAHIFALLAVVSYILMAAIMLGAVPKSLSWWCLLGCLSPINIFLWYDRGLFWYTLRTR